MYTLAHFRYVHVPGLAWLRQDRRWDTVASSFGYIP
jgi:hypothetical protein